MEGKVYRNIYIHGSAIGNLSGTVDVHYSGHIFNNARHIANFDSMYDAAKDLYIVCGSCAARKYRRFIKMK